MKSKFTGKFKIGDLVKTNENSSGTVVQIRPGKKSHNYQVKLSEDVADSFWFSEMELEEIKGELV